MQNNANEDGVKYGGGSPFPTIRRSLESLIEDEGGTIPPNKLVTIGAFLVVFGMLYAAEAWAAHSSHSSHRSHTSHSSTAYHRSHVSHTSHSSGSHSSSAHSSHSSHSSSVEPDPYVDADPGTDANTADEPQVTRNMHSSHSNNIPSVDEVVAPEAVELTPDASPSLMLDLQDPGMTPGEDALLEVVD